MPNSPLNGSAPTLSKVAVVLAGFLTLLVLARIAVKVFLGVDDPVFTPAIQATIAAILLLVAALVQNYHGRS